MPVPAQILAAIRQPAFVYLADGTVGAANDRAEALAERPLAGMTAADVIACFSVRHRDGPGVAPPDLPAVQALAGEEAVDVPLTITAADGRTMHLLATASPIRDGNGVAGALSIWQDVTGEVEAARALAAQSDALQAREEEVAQQNEELREQSDALRESERRYRELVDSANSAIIRWRVDGTVTFANDYALALFGHAADDLIGQNVDLLLPSRDSTGADLSGLVSEIVARPEHRRTNVNENVRADGTRLWMLWTNRAILDEDRAVTEVLSVGTDITGRRAAEDAVAGLERESRGRLAELEAVYDAAPMGLAVLDRDLRYVRINRVLAAINRRPVEAHLGRTVREIMPTMADQVEGTVRRVLETGETVQDVALSADFPADRGPAVYLLTQWAPVRDGQGEITGITVATVDITGLKRAEEELRETRDYLDNLITYANAPIIVWDPEFRITRFNAAFEHLSGYAVDEVIGRDLVILFPEESREESLEKIQRTITERWQSVEIPILRPDGGIRIALWNSANIYDREGTTLLATIAQGQDITERNEAEAALREYAEGLRRSNEDLERFAYVASHDLQEPLRSVVSFSQLLERRYRGQLSPDADEYIAFIVEGGTRMQGLILDLLAFSRVNTTRQQIAQTDAEDVLAEAMRSLDVSLREANAALTHDPLPVVMADPTQLAQVFSNLVSNAVKFRRADEPLHVHVGARRLDGFWEFSVSDNGIGIEPQYFDKIFVIFQRLHTRETYPGTGIGLAIVKRIIDRHGGRIWVESTPGVGSTFFFTLPTA